MPSARAASAPPSRSVSRSGGRSTSASRSVAMSLNARSSSACSISARRTDGFSRTAPAIAASSVAVAAQDVGRRLLADPLRAGQPVRRVAAQRDEVRHGGRRDAVALLDLGGAHLVRPLLAGALEQDRDPVAGALEHVAVAGEDHRVPARVRLAARVRVHQVVGLERVVGGHGPAERLVERGRALPLVRERVRHVRAVRVVRRVELGAVRGRFLTEAAHDRARLVAVDAPQQLVDGAEQRVDRPALAVGDAVGQREERAVQQVRRVGEQQGLWHPRGG